METIHENQVDICRSVGEEQRIVAALVLGFSSDPVLRWLYPDSASYVSFFPEFIRAFGGRAFENRSAYHAADFTGGALWLPPNQEPDEERFVELIQRSTTEDKQDIVFRILEQMDAYHPSEPCWYLPLIGVDPMHQGSGLGSALLQTVLRECDRHGLPAYLEATNTRNVRLYDRHGFEALGTIKVENAPSMTPMLRQPRN